MKKYENSDYDMICEWYRARELMSPRRKDLPTLGFIVPGVAAGFLVQTDCAVAILDFFIANPAVGRKKRNSALNEIMTALIAQANWLGFRMISASSKLECTQNRATNHGMKFSGYFSMFSREL